MKNLTNHFNERWVERIVGITSEKEKKDYLARNRQMIAEHANETFERAQFLYKGQLGDNTTKHYYIKDDIVLISNTTDDALITVYKVDLGFTDDLNKTVRRGLLEEIAKLNAQKEDLDFQILQEVESKEQEAISLADQIKIMEEQVQNLRKQKEFIDLEVKNIKSKSLNTGLDVKRYTLMLVNSKEYKEDMRNIR